MEFTIHKETFLKALQKVQGIVEKRNTMPILSNVLLEATAGVLQVTATDLEVGMKSSYEASIVKDGKITVSAKKVYEIIRELPDAEIHFATRANDWVEIRCGKAFFSIVGLSSDEFPYFQKVNEEAFISLDAAQISGMIEKTAYAICHDETKYNLNGIFIRASEKEGRNVLTMVATDGHRLSLVEQGYAGAVGKEMGKGFILPKKGVFELKKIADEGDGQILFGIQDSSAVVRRENTTVIMRLVDGEFPDYTKVIPVANDRVVLVRREEFLHSLKRMAILSSEKFKGIKFEVNPGTMTISSSNPEFGEANEEMEITYDGAPLVARFNARYLIDVASVLQGDEVRLLFRDELSPALVKPAGEEGFLAVVMPMRI
jgi:DNA polymerase-3 subunit beta